MERPGSTNRFDPSEEQQGGQGGSRCLEEMQSVRKVGVRNLGSILTPRDSFQLGMACYPMHFFKNHSDA